VMQGSNQTFTITANTDYQVTNVLVDSASVGAVASYTFTNVTVAHTISASFTMVIPYTVPFFEPFEARNPTDLDGQYGWIADGTVVQTNTTFNNSTQAAQISGGGGGYLKRSFLDGRTKVWTDMRVQMVQCQEKPIPETNSTVAVFVWTNSIVWAFDGTTVRSTDIAVVQGTNVWTRFTTFSDYTTKKYILYVNDVRAAGKYGFYNAAVTNFTELKVSGGATFVDNVGITLNQPGMKGMPSLILFQ